MPVRFLGPDTDAYVASVERHASEFEERTGLELDIHIVPSDLYFSNDIRLCWKATRPRTSTCPGRS